MNAFIDSLKKLRLRQIVTVFLAGVLLMVSTACSGANAQDANTKRYDPTKSYELNTPKGGMNNFSDVDPRAKADEKAAEAKAKALRDNAQKNVAEKGIDSKEQYIRNYNSGTPLGERVKNLGEDVSSSTEEVREGLVKGTQRGIENIKENTQNAAENLTKNIQRGTENIKENTQNTAENLTKNVKRGTEDAARNIQQRGEDTADAINKTVR